MPGASGRTSWRCRYRARRCSAGRWRPYRRSSSTRTVVVSQYPEVLELAHRMGFVPVPNRHPDWGISHTISLGLGKLPEMDAALFQVADQPLLRRESVGSLVDFYREHPEHIAALGHDGVRGNPCLFPARLFPELLALQGDHGGNQVIRRHEEDLLLWEVPAPELTDVDTPQVLAQLRRDMAGGVRGGFYDCLRRVTFFQSWHFP